MSLTPPPDPPSIDDPENFSVKAQAFVEWLVTFRDELDAIIGVTIPAGSAAAGTLTGATLAANVLASSLTSLGVQAADLKFLDATYDIGKSGATRPRDFFLSRNALIGGTLGVTGQSNLGNTAVTGNLTASENSGIAATKRFYWDGIGINGDTYTVESSGNVLQTVVNGNLRQNLTGATCTYYGMYAQGGGESEGIWSPGTDNSYTLGFGAKRWTVVYATTGTINTSSALDKTKIIALNEAELAAAKQISKEIGTFQFLDAIKAKGDGARRHVGLTVQRAIEIMEEHGLNPFSYGFICYDEWEEKRVEHPAEVRVEETGILDGRGGRITREVVVKEAWTKITPAGSQYGFRTDELMLFIARGLDARMSSLEGDPDPQPA